MMPIDFCASFDPCANAIRLDEISCARRAIRFTVAARERRKIHVSAIIRLSAMKKPAAGDEISGTSTLRCSAPQLNAEKPPRATTAPASEPISACDELDGMPNHHVNRFQKHAPHSADSTTTWLTSFGSAKPAAMVLATAVPVSAPVKSSAAASSTAVRTGKTPVETTVAIALAAS
jgi:hypothetical protein